MPEEKSTIKAPFYQTLIDSFMTQYEPCSSTDPDRMEFSQFNLRDFFIAYQDFTTGLDPFPRYIEELQSRGYKLSNNAEGDPCMFVKEAFAEFQELQL